jgi:hypothetical protein
MLLVAAVVVAILFPCHRNDLGWVDPICGSVKHQTQLFGLTLSTVIEPSALERWIVDREGKYTNSWSMVQDTSSHLVFGKVYACGTAPEIYPLSRIEFNERFVQSSTDTEIAEFIRVMRTGTLSERRQAVDKACDKTLESLKRDR